MTVIILILILVQVSKHYNLQLITDQIGELLFLVPRTLFKLEYAPTCVIGGLTQALVRGVQTVELTGTEGDAGVLLMLAGR